MHESLDEFEFQSDWTTDCGVSCLERLKNPHRLIWENEVSTFSRLFLIGSFSVILAGNDNIHKSLDEFEILLDPTTGFHDNR